MSQEETQTLEVIENHSTCDASIVHPHGQIQGMKDCWCKLYHAFGQTVQMENVDTVHFKDDIYCYIWIDAEKNKQPLNQYLERKLKKKVFGPVIMFRKGEDLQMEKARGLLQ
jgi:hypothetical protein